ncbi:MULTISPECIES: hypothetical protein [Bhargavaea]|uniref:Uncharacterized protein n=1 Tax=Bhargavaea changchunensis TaxID=2134037 RepID=A0ABW2NGX9_9BACL|nr:hypothetical protein [Bhargavaea sp. CC-171006]
MSKKLLTKKEKNKLLFSETIKNSGVNWLIRILRNKEDLKEEYLSHEQILIFRELKSNLLNNSIKEWEITLAPNGHFTLDKGPKETGWEKCQLCGTKNRYVHFIKNKFNNRILNVGSECINEFGDIGLMAHRDRRQLISEQNKNYRMQKLIKEIPWAKSRVENWNQFFSEVELILPNRIEEPYVKAGKIAERTLNKILSKNNNKAEIEKLKALFEKQEKYQSKVFSYIQKYIGHPFAMTKEIDDWLRINNPGKHMEIKGRVKKHENALIDAEVASLINEPGFLAILKDRYTTNLDKDRIQFLENSKYGFICSVYPYFDIKLEISNKNFTTAYGKFLFSNDEAFNEKYLLFNSKCFDSTDIERLLTRYMDELKRCNMTIVNINRKKNQLDIKSNKTKNYYRLDLKGFTEKNMFNLYSKRLKEILKEIIKTNNSFSHTEYTNLIKRERDIRSSYRDEVTK